MQNGNIKLTATDRMILNSYSSMLDGLADYLGTGFEFVLHSLEDYESSVIKIINGHHTGRKLGAPITDLALNMFTKIQDENLDGYISYESKNKNGRPLYSTTISVYGENQRIIGLICINFYVDTPFSEIFPIFEMLNKSSHSTMNENFADDVDTLIEEAYSEAYHQVMTDGSISSILKNKEIINVLHNQGIFRIKDAVVKVAKLMNVSKNTVYMHLRGLKEKQ
jgi:predicted transcriptional regulator YheO